MREVCLGVSRLIGEVSVVQTEGVGEGDGVETLKCNREALVQEGGFTWVLSDS